MGTWFSTGLGSGSRNHGSDSQNWKDPACLPGLEILAVSLSGRHEVGWVGWVPWLWGRLGVPEHVYPIPGHYNF